MVNNNYHVSDFKEVVAQLKEFGVESIRNGETDLYEKTTELTRKTAFSDAKLTEYSVAEIFGASYEIAKNHVEKYFTYPNKPCLDVPEKFTFDDVLAMWLYVAWRMSLIINHGERIKIYFSDKDVSVKVIKNYYSQTIIADEWMYYPYRGELELNCMKEIEEVYKTIENSKLLTEVKINFRVAK
jgi:hypothetical protein